MSKQVTAYKDVFIVKDVKRKQVEIEVLAYRLQGDKVKMYWQTATLKIGECFQINNGEKKEQIKLDTLINKNE